MQNDVTPDLLEKISALSELHNSLDDAAKVLGLSSDRFAEILSSHGEARARWEKGGIEAVNQLKINLTRQAMAGSVQAAKLLKDWQAETPKKIAPLSAATTSAPEKKRASGEGLRWRTLAEQAEKFGPSPTYMREAIAHPVHPLAYKEVGGRWCVQAAVVFAWIRGYASRRPPKLKVALDAFDVEELAASEKPAASAPAPALMDVLAILNTVDCSGGGESGVELEKLKIAKAEALRRHIDSEIARQKLFRGDDVVKMLRSLGEVYCETLEAHAGAQAADLIKVIREKMDVDLSTHFSGASQVLVQALCDQGNRIVIAAIRREVLNQVEGVQMLEGTA